MNTETLIKTTKTGQRISVIGNHVCVDGIPESSALDTIAKHPSRAQIQKALPGATHVAGRVILTAEEAAIAQAALDAFQTTAEGIEAKLSAERKSLVAKIACHLDDAAYHGTRAWESGQSTDGGFGVRAKHEALANAARAELAKFDTQHPEILAKIKAKKEAEQRELAERAWRD